MNDDPSTFEATDNFINRLNLWLSTVLLIGAFASVLWLIVEFNQVW
jgi:hypothetical protein